MIDPAWLAVILPVAVAAGTAAGGYWTSRRTGSGRIGTSNAEALWEQTQTMLSSMQQRLDREQHAKERAEDQRDRLMDLQKDQTIPVLEAISQSQKHVLGLLTELVGRVEQMEKKS